MRARGRERRRGGCKEEKRRVLGRVEEERERPGELSGENRMETVETFLGRVTSRQHSRKPRRWYPGREQRLSILLRARVWTLYCMGTR